MAQLENILKELVGSENLFLQAGTEKHFKDWRILDEKGSIIVREFLDAVGGGLEYKIYTEEPINGSVFLGKNSQIVFDKLAFRDDVDFYCDEVACEL